MIEKTVLSLSYGRLVVKPEERLRGLVPESFETYQIVNPGNIVIRATDLQNDQVSIRVGYANNRGVITAAYLCLETRPVVSPKFGYRYLAMCDATKALYRFGSGLRQNLDASDIRRMPVLVPPAAEQAAIVRFLDDVDRRIRRYIAGKRKLVALLNEQKQGIVQRVITRGVVNGVTTRASGVDWLGDIPAHWKVARAKAIFREVDRRSADGSEVLLSMRMIAGLVPHREVSGRPIDAGALVGFKKVTPGDLVMNRMRAATGMFRIARQEGIVSPDYAVLRADTRTASADYYEMLFRTAAMAAVFRKESRGLGTGSSGFLRLYTERFGLVHLPVPPIDEQREIVRHVSAATAAVDEQIGVALRALRLASELRIRLVADVVTGKLDVCDIAARLAEGAEEREVLDETQVDAERNEVAEETEAAPGADEDAA